MEPNSNKVKESQALPEKPEKYRWKKSYTLVLLANAAYILFFYFLMNTFT